MLFQMNQGEKSVVNVFIIIVVLFGSSLYWLSGITILCYSEGKFQIKLYQLVTLYILFISGCYINYCCMNIQ